MLKVYVQKLSEQENYNENNLNLIITNGFISPSDLLFLINKNVHRTSFILWLGIFAFISHFNRIIFYFVRCISNSMQTHQVFRCVLFLFNPRLCY